MMKIRRYIFGLLIILTISPEIYSEPGNVLIFTNPVLQRRMKHQPPMMGLRLRYRFSKGVRLYNDAKYIKAKDVFADLAEDYPYFPAAHEYLGFIAIRQNNFQAAKREAEIISKLKPKSAKAHLITASLLLKKGNRSGAVKNLRMAQQYSTDIEERKEIESHISTFRLRGLLIKEEVIEKPVPLPVEDIDTVRVDFSDQIKYDKVNVKPYIAIFPFKDTGAKSEETRLGESVAEMLITALIQTNRFKVMERTQLNKVMEEQALGQSGAMDQETAANVGKLVGVDAVIVGSVSYLGPVIELDARLVNAENGEAISAGSASAQGEVNIRDAVNEVALLLGKYAVKIPVTSTETDTSSK